LAWAEKVVAGCRNVNARLDQAFDVAITRAKQVLKQEIILQIGAEGGDLTLYGSRTASGWLFNLGVYDGTPLLLDDGEPAIQHTSSRVTCWTDAIALLERYPWTKLHPLRVHPDFRKQVWHEVESRLNHERDGDYLDEWRRICET
jgi:hypothetical protein